MHSENGSEETCIDINDYLSSRAFDWTSVTSVRVIVSIAYCIIFSVGVLGNAGVVAKVAKHKKLRSARNLFLVNLIASDFLLCLTAIPFTPVSVITKRWIFGGVICRLIPLCQSMSVIITSHSLTAIAVDKYVHIIDATKPPITSRQAATAIGAIWALAGFLNIPLVMSYDVVDGALYTEEYGLFCGEFCDEVNWVKLEYKRVYGTSVMFLQFVIPMLIIIFCYACIMRKVQADLMVDNKQFSSSLSAMQRLKAAKNKRKVNHILIMMVVAFIGAWLPLTTFNILRDYSLLPAFISYQPFLWALIVHSTAMTTVIWNPLLFFWLTGRSHRRRRNLHTISRGSFSLSNVSNPLRVFRRRKTNRLTDGSHCEENCCTYEEINIDREYSSNCMTQGVNSMERDRCPSSTATRKDTSSHTLAPPMPKKISRSEQLVLVTKLA